MRVLIVVVGVELLMRKEVVSESRKSKRECVMQVRADEGG